MKRDAVEFLRTETKLKFDLIILDPPTFSNSKKMDGTFDVQRDHAALIGRCLKMLNPEGTLVFSNNFQKFQLNLKAGPLCEVQEISAFTVPGDFHKTAHRCWLIRAPRSPQLLLKKLEQP